MGARGKVGRLVTYPLGKKQVIRALPSKKKKRKASELQEMHRFAFLEMHRFARTIKRQIIDRIWIYQSTSGNDLNPYNLFMRTNRTAFGHSETIIFPDQLVISKGNLYPAEGFQVKRSGDTLQFSWNKNYNGRYARLEDRLNLFVLAERFYLKPLEIKVLREDGIAVVPFTETSEPIEGYAFWSSMDDSDFSPSVYWKL